MFSYEFCKISKNTFFTEHLLWLLLIAQNWKAYVYLAWLKDSVSGAFKILSHKTNSLNLRKRVERKLLTSSALIE